MKWMKPVFDITFSYGKWFSYGKGGLKQCWHKIRRGGYLIIILDYKGGWGGVKNLGKGDYVISE